jgi:hypothetical protein
LYLTARPTISASCEQREMRRIFGRLNIISENYRPGFVDALNRTYTTDWNKYIEDAKRDLLDAAEQRHSADRR